MDYANYPIEDLYYFLEEAEAELVTLALCPEGIETEGFAEKQATVDAIYDEIERRKDLYRT